MFLISNRVSDTTCLSWCSCCPHDALTLADAASVLWWSDHGSACAQSRAQRTAGGNPQNCKQLFAFQQQEMILKSVIQTMYTSQRLLQIALSIVGLQAVCSFAHACLHSSFICFCPLSTLKVMYGHVFQMVIHMRMQRPVVTCALISRSRPHVQLARLVGG